MDRDTEILKKAIQKSIDSGFIMDSLSNEDVRLLAIYVNGAVVDNDNTDWDVKTVIFSHDFAKAFWGDQTCENFHKLKLMAGRRTPFTGLNLMPPQFMWQYHLQQMVLKEDPIQYLKQFIS